jgi:hypothetical protein
VLVLAARGGAGSKRAASSVAAAPECPPAWKAGWQRLANDVGAPVYCPAWMPFPLDAQIGGRYANGRWADPDSYLVSFVWLDRDAGVNGEVHVNLRGYPGETRIPTCEDTRTVKGATIRTKIPCFSDPRGVKKIGGLEATLNTVNQGIDEWHVLYAWKRDGSLYAVSEHVAPPYTYGRVVRNLERMLRGLVLVRPSG